MTPTHRYYSPDHTDQSAAAHTGDEVTGDEPLIDTPHGTTTLSDDDNLDDTENVISAEDDETRVSNSDSTIMDAGGSAGGLSGNGERTDEYDAAVMGLDD